MPPIIAEVSNLGRGKVISRWENVWLKKCGIIMSNTPIVTEVIKGTMYSQQYVQHLSIGPFPDQIDPWAEVGHYFQQIHGLMIDSLITQLNPQLVAMGYIVGKEASLQIAEGREPDIYVQRTMNAPEIDLRWDYELAASEVLANPGIVVEPDVDLQAIHIKESGSGRLVTVVEIVLQNNKTKPEVITDYRMRRERLLFEHRVNVVEIDPTRSVKRLISPKASDNYAYHVAFHLAGMSFRVVGIDFGNPLPRVALPLRGEVVPLELHRAYDFAYQLVTIAGQINDDRLYAEEYLPFPSLLTDAERAEAVKTVNKWQEKLETLKTEQNGNG